MIYGEKEKRPAHEIIDKTLTLSKWQGKKSNLNSKMVTEFCGDIAPHMVDDNIDGHCSLFAWNKNRYISNPTGDPAYSLK